jgi:heptose I phosphotransferase
MTEAVDSDWRQRLSAAGLRALAELLDDAAGTHRRVGIWELLSKPGLGGRERWRWELAGGAGGAATLYVKRYRRLSMREQLDRMLRQDARHSRAWWEYAQSRTLRERYIPAVQAVGFVERMAGPLEVESAALFAAAPGDAFDRLWPRLDREHAPITCGAVRHDLVRRLARFISAFHQSGVCHRDLYLCHVFSELDAQGRVPPRFTLIDLARTHAPRWRRMRWLVKDLAQLDSSARGIGATRTDRLRFLRAYLGLAPGAPRVRVYARRVVRKSDAIIRRDHRKARRRPRV